MSRIVACAVLALAGSCASVPRPYGQGVTLHTVATAGYRVLNYEDFDGHEVYALELVTRDSKSGLGYEIGGSYGFEDESGDREPSAVFNEVFLGLRKSWELDSSRARPYVGAGGAFTRIENHLDSPTDQFNDEGGAAYLHAGVLWPIGPLPIERGTEVLLGFDVRGLAGYQYDSAQLGLVLAFGR
jgi:hypothetical protein